MSDPSAEPNSLVKQLFEWFPQQYPDTQFMQMCSYTGVSGKSGKSVEYGRPRTEVPTTWKIHRLIQTPGNGVSEEDILRLLMSNPLAYQRISVIVTPKTRLYIDVDNIPRGKLIKVVETVQKAIHAHMFVKGRSFSCVFDRRDKAPDLETTHIVWPDCFVLFDDLSKYVHSLIAVLCRHYYDPALRWQDLIDTQVCHRGHGKLATLFSQKLHSIHKPPGDGETEFQSSQRKWGGQMDATGNVTVSLPGGSSTQAQLMWLRERPCWGWQDQAAFIQCSADAVAPAAASSSVTRLQWGSVFEQVKWNQLRASGARAAVVQAIEQLAADRRFSFPRGKSSLVELDRLRISLDRGNASRFFLEYLADFCPVKKHHENCDHHHRSNHLLVKVDLDQRKARLHCFSGKCTGRDFVIDLPGVLARYLLSQSRPSLVVPSDKRVCAGGFDLHALASTEPHYRFDRVQRVVVNEHTVNFELTTVASALFGPGQVACCYRHICALKQIYDGLDTGTVALTLVEAGEDPSVVKVPAPVVPALAKFWMFASMQGPRVRLYGCLPVHVMHQKQLFSAASTTLVINELSLPCQNLLISEGMTQFLQKTTPRCSTPVLVVMHRWLRDPSLALCAPVNLPMYQQELFLLMHRVMSSLKSGGKTWQPTSEVELIAARHIYTVLRMMDKGLASQWSWAYRWLWEERIRRDVVGVPLDIYGSPDNIDSVLAEIAEWLCHERAGPAPFELCLVRTSKPTLTKFLASFAAHESDEHLVSQLVAFFGTNTGLSQLVECLRDPKLFPCPREEKDEQPIPTVLEELTKYFMADSNVYNFHRVPDTEEQKQPTTSSSSSSELQWHIEEEEMWEGDLGTVRNEEDEEFPDSQDY